MPLLLLNSSNQSILAHDEGLYALRARLMQETGDWINPWDSPHHKLPGIYWLIGGFYTVMGVSETAARLPSILAAITSVLLLYDITTRIFNARVGWLAAAILSLEVLWLRYARLAGPDPIAICLILITVACLLRAEQHPEQRHRWGFGAGLSLALGFLFRGFTVVVPIGALLPYLLLQNSRHRHLWNPAIYVGAIVGLLPSLLWIGANWLRFGSTAIAQLLGLVVRLGSNQRYDNTVLYYFWNVPANTFPWIFFSLLGLWVLWRRPVPNYQWLVVGYPLLFFVGISAFSTRLPHYALLLYPWLAILAAVGVEWLSDRSAEFYRTRPFRILTTVVIGSFGLLALAGLVLLFLPLAKTSADSLRQYGAIALATGIGGLLPALFRRSFAAFKLPSIALSCLLAVWLGLATAGGAGLMGDYNPELKQFVQRSEIASVLQTQPVHFVKVEGKNYVLLRFYTPHWGRELNHWSEVPANSNAWNCMEPPPEPAFKILGSTKQCQLIHRQ